MLDFSKGPYFTGNHEGLLVSKQNPLELKTKTGKTVHHAILTLCMRLMVWFGPSAWFNSPAHPVFVGLCLGVVRLHQQGVPLCMTLAPQVPPEKQQFQTNPGAFICKLSKTWRK